MDDYDASGRRARLFLALLVITICALALALPWFFRLPS